MSETTTARTCGICNATTHRTVSDLRAEANRVMDQSCRTRNRSIVQAYAKKATRLYRHADELAKAPKTEAPAATASDDEALDADYIAWSDLVDAANAHTEACRELSRLIERRQLYFAVLFRARATGWTSERAQLADRAVERLTARIDATQAEADRHYAIIRAGAPLAHEKPAPARQGAPLAQPGRKAA